MDCPTCKVKMVKKPGLYLGMTAKDGEYMAKTVHICPMCYYERVKEQVWREDKELEPK